MGFMDKAKELAAKADQAISGLDGPNPNREAEPVFRDLGAKIFEREQGRSDVRIESEIAQLIERLRGLEAQAPGGRLATGGTTTGPPPPGAAAAPPPPGGSAPAAPPPPPPAAATPPPPPPPAPATPPPPPPPPGTV